jgi:glutathione peroxidase-family protein/precorrin-6B methylase 2
MPLRLILLSFIFFTSLGAQVLRHEIKTLEGQPIHLGREFLGKVVLLVNTASRCGATDQYSGLQNLHETYHQKGLAVVALPSNDFGAQEPGSHQEIAKFCQQNYGVSFTMLEKTKVSGKQAHPWVIELTQKNKNEELNKPIGWNFEKFLIDRDGKLVARFNTGTEPESEKLIQKIEALLEKEPQGVNEYLGRQTAMTMHWKGAPWLIRKRREAEESTTNMIKAMQIQPGQILCDMGAGNGYHTLKMSELTGKKGLVYAVDVQPEMLKMLKERAKKANINNIKTIVNKYYNTGLPKASIDKMLMCDVYHEFSHPEHMLNDIYKALKPDGELMLVEFRKEDKAVPIKEDHKMSAAQVIKEMEANGFVLSRRYDELPWQHFLVFKKA